MDDRVSLTPWGLQKARWAVMSISPGLFARDEQLSDTRVGLRSGEGHQ